MIGKLQGAEQEASDLMKETGELPAIFATMVKNARARQYSKNKSP